MRRIALIPLGYTLLILADRSQAEDMACGTTDTWADRMTTQYLIPETYPFDEKATAALAPALRADYLEAEKCREFGVAYWSPACLEHDRCMEAIGMYGQSSETCHNNLLKGWQNACSQKYGLTSSEIQATQQGWGSIPEQMRLSRKVFCLEHCKDMAGIAYKIMAGAASSFPAGQKLIADVNGNGTRDAILFPKTNRMYVDLEMRKAARRFSPTVDIWASKYYKVGDFNGDNRDDLIMLVSGSDYSHPYYSNGDGTFSVGGFRPWPGYYIGDPALYHVGDFNNDDVDDLIHFVPGHDYVNIWYGNRSNGFSVGSFRPWLGYGMGGQRIKVGDFDGDGYKDDFVDLVGTYLHTWKGNGNGTFSLGTWTPWEGYGHGPASDYTVFDFDQNGVDDIFHSVPGWKWFGNWNFVTSGFPVAKADLMDLLRMDAARKLPY